MSDIIINVLLIVFEIFCCKIFYETFGKVRYKGFVNIIQLFVLSGCQCVVAFSLSNYFVIKQVAIVTVFSGFMVWHIKISVKKSFVLSILYESLLLAVDYIAFTVNSSFFSGIEVKEEYYPFNGALVVLLSKVILFLCILIIRKQFARKSTDMLVDTEWLRFLFFPVFTIAITSAMLSVFEYVNTKEQAILLFIIAFGMAGMNLMVFYLINDIMRRETHSHQNQIFDLQIKNQAEMYRAISENLDKQRRKAHEYENQIMCIESMLNKKQYGECENFVKEIYGNIHEEKETINTNNVIVNAIINTKYQEMASKGIAFVFRVNDLSNLKIKDEDVVTILSNLLNNAIEACEGCKKEKIVKLKFVKEEDKIIISVKNTFNHVIRYENGEIKTTKLSDVEDHGMGIKNIIRVIEKYNGLYVIDDSKKEFYFSIVIPA